MRLRAIPWHGTVDERSLLRAEGERRANRSVSARVAGPVFRPNVHRRTGSGAPVEVPPIAGLPRAAEAAYDREEMGGLAVTGREEQLAGPDARSDRPSRPGRDSRTSARGSVRVVRVARVVGSDAGITDERTDARAAAR